MSDLRKAAEMALEEFELFFNTYPHMEKGYTLDAREALRQALEQPDMGIDRGAWSDVPDATKWVDELRGDEEPPNSTTDVVESKSGFQTEQNPVAYLYHDTVSAEFANPLADSTLLVLACDRKQNGRNETPLYTAPPKPAQDLIVGYAENHDINRSGHDFWVSRQPGKNTVPLYLYGHPPKIWQGLTDEERRGIPEWQKIQEELGSVWAPMMLYLYLAIEAKLKEKNT